MRTKFLFCLMLLSIAAFGQQNPIQIDANGLTQTLAAGGIVNRGQIVKINSAGQVVPVATTDTSGAIGIAATSQQNVGQSISISIAGTPLVQIDSSGCAAGNIVSFSTSAGGSGHCAATASTQQVGVALSISSPGSNFWNVALSLGGGSGGVTGQFSLKTFGAVGDAKKTFTATTVSSSATITDVTNAPWLSSDVGKKIYCIGGSNANALTVTIATISAFNSTSSISISPATGNNNTNPGATECVWFTQKDTAAFTAATAAALVSTHNNFSSTSFPYNGTVYCPPGGYVVDAPFFQTNSGSVGFGASFVGSGIGSCVIYISPDVTVSNNGWMIVVNAMTDFTISDFTVDCSKFSFAVNGQAFRIVNSLRFNMNRIYMRGCTTSGDGTGMIFLSGTNGLVSDHISVDGTGNPAFNEPTLVLGNGSTGAHVREFITTNPGSAPLVISSSCGPGVNGSRRNTNGSSCLFEASVFDEGATAANITLTGSTANFSGITAFAGATSIVSLDATSSVWMDKSVLVPFGAACAGGNIPGIALAAGAYFYSTGNIISSCGTAGAVNGTSTSIFVDGGGNTLQNCVAGTCSAITATTFATLGFTGGVISTPSVQMPTNTVYAVTGNLLATAQNLATIPLTVNQQLTAIRAQSGGTTPAASSCATPPVITFSDGTRSATMTMTSGKTQWTSSVDAVTSLNQIFATGATLTISIGANTCATPPSNVSVSYNVQSVLNQ